MKRYGMKRYGMKRSGSWKDGESNSVKKPILKKMKGKIITKRAVVTDDYIQAGISPGGPLKKKGKLYLRQHREEIKQQEAMMKAHKKAIENIPDEILFGYKPKTKTK
jgi:hypothetical protein